MINVFGSTGFVGSHFMDRSKHKLYAASRQERSGPGKENIYFISTTDNYNVLEDPYKDIEVNLTLLVKHLEKLKPGDTFNFISSWFVYGDTKLVPAREDAPCNPKGFYSITKLAAEGLVESYCKTFNINYRIFRLSNIYGPGEKNATKKKNALLWIIERLKNHEKVELYWGGDCLRNYIHVYDLVDALDLCLESGPLNEITNIGVSYSLRFGMIVDMAAKIINSNSEIVSIPPPIFHEIVQARHFVMDTIKLRSLGFQSKIFFEEGIKEICLNQA